MSPVLTSTDLPKPKQQGKVRDIYDLEDALLLVATDRLSAFDIVLPGGVPDRGVVLNELSRFWFDKSEHIVPNHFLAMGHDTNMISQYLSDLPHEVARRGMLVKKAQPIMVECVVRGYLSGSAWAEYRKSGTIGGETAPEGLSDSARLDSPTFTPTTKAMVGHDEAITIAQMESMVGQDLTETLGRISISLYSAAHEFALTKGIIIADTKFEFGMVNEEITLIDEVLTPDSSRFWSADSYKPGQAQDSLDKQFVRDWLENTGWDKEPPPPTIPDDVLERTSARYKDVHHRLTGESIS